MGYRTGFGTKPISAPSLVSRGPQRYADPMAIFHLTHRTIGRSTHAAGTAGAHIGYITRSAACRAVIAEHIPTAEPGSKGGAARAWLDAQEEADHKNARVIDKLEIALPLELDQAQRVELVRAFVLELSGGKSVPFFAAFHDKAGTKDEANPHVHLVIRDRDPATGKGRVIGMSEKGSTERAREVWEQICNEALRDLNHRARIDRRSLADQGITDRKSPGHEGPQARQIEAKRRPAEKLTRIREARNIPGRPEHLLSARERAAEREREAAWQLRTPQALDTPTRRSERVLEGLRRVAEGIWQGQRDRDAARKALRASASGALGTRFLPEPITRHIEDIAAIVFRRKPKQPMPLREASPFSGSRPWTGPHAPRQTPNPDGRIRPSV
jgi:hypothetical protein